MTTMTIECSSFTATPIGEGRVRLDIAEPAQPRKAVYSAGEAVARISELLGKQFSHGSLNYWRKQGLPFVRIGDKKIVYNDDDLVLWAQGRMGSAFP
jgi:hypothetical protein